MFSRKFHWDLRPNRLALLTEAKRRAGTPLLDLTESNPTRAGISYPEELVFALADARALLYDPAPAGSVEAREAVAAWYGVRGAPVHPDHIILTCSTSEAYSYLFKLLADPGDEVLVPRPSYPLFEFLAAMESLEVRSYPLLYHGSWFIDLDRLVASITSRTRAIVVVNPNNPTGSYLKTAELEVLAPICRDRGIALISDEVFSEYAFAPDPQRVRLIHRTADCLCFSLGGLSKAAGLPQMKLGWIVASGQDSLTAQALEKLEWIADTYLSVSTPVQCAALRLLDAGAGIERQIARHTGENLESLRQRIGGTAVSLLHIEGGWYGTLRVPRVRTEEEWALLLLERHNVLVQPGFFYDMEGDQYLIVSFLTHSSDFATGITRLLQEV
jgi:aspartate/methionine/tyrosine aminotransferase